MSFSYLGFAVFPPLDFVKKKKKKNKGRGLFFNFFFF